MVGLAVKPGRVITDRPVCVLGAAFKPGSDDVRDSPALDVAQILHGMGAEITVYDPAAMADARRDMPKSATVTPAHRGRAGAHLCCCSLNGPNSPSSDRDDLDAVAAQRNIVDGRNVLDPALWRAAGWNYRALGTASTPPTLDAFCRSA